MLGAFEHALLITVLKLRENAYGRAIHDELESRLGKEIAMGAMYLTLERLERKGLLKSEWGEPLPKRGGRARRYYGIQRAGVAALNETRQVMQDLWQGVEWPIGARS